MEDERFKIINSAFDRRKIILGLASGAAAAGLSGWPSQALAQSANCINGNSGFLGPQGTWRVFENAPPLASNSASFNYWPCTDAFTWNQGSAPNAVLNSSSWTGGNCWVYMWANRAINPNGNPKPNNIQIPVPTFPTECRVQYTTVAKANAATQSQIRYWLGMGNYADPWTHVGGLASDFVFYSQLYNNPGNYFNSQVTADGYPVITDVPWLLSTQSGGAGSFTRTTMMKGNLSRVPGIVLDYEVGDRRTAAQSTEFFQSIYNDIHGSGANLFIYTDPLDRLANDSGLDSTNLPAILQNYCDYLTVLLTNNSGGNNIAQSYESQIAILKGQNCMGIVPYSKLALLFDVGTTSLNDAQFVNNILRGSAASNPQAIVIWRDGATQGGTCTANPGPNYQVIAALEGSAATGQPGTPVAPTAIPNGWSPTCPFP